MIAVRHADWFGALLATTVVFRGLGAGAIFNVALSTLPIRRRLGVVAFAQFTRAQYPEGGRQGAGLAALAALFAATTFALAIWWRASPFVTWTILSSLVATALAFVGTARAFPAMTSLWKTNDHDSSLLGLLLDRIARWATFSASWNVIAFILTVTALAAAHN